MCVKHMWKWWAAFEDSCICISKGHSAWMLHRMIDAAFHVHHLTLPLTPGPLPKNVRKFTLGSICVAEEHQIGKYPLVSFAVCKIETIVVWGGEIYLRRWLHELCVVSTFVVCMYSYILFTTAYSVCLCLLPSVVRHILISLCSRRLHICICAALTAPSWQTTQRLWAHTLTTGTERDTHNQVVRIDLVTTFNAIWDLACGPQLPLSSA